MQPLTDGKPETENVPGLGAITENVSQKNDNRFFQNVE